MSAYKSHLVGPTSDRSPESSDLVTPTRSLFYIRHPKPRVETFRPIVDPAATALRLSPLRPPGTLWQSDARAGGHEQPR